MTIELNKTSTIAIEGIPTEVIFITTEEYENLTERDAFLCALEGSGVDNWSGYEDAQDMLDEWRDE